MARQPILAVDDMKLLVPWHNFILYSWVY